MKKKIESYITRNYYQLLKIAKKLTNNHDLHQDLLHEVILQILEKDDVVLKTYDDDSIRYYIVAIIRINWNSKTSPLYYKIRREISKYTDLTPILEIEEDQQQFEKELIFSILEVSYTELNFFHKALMDAYLILGSMNKVSREMEIPLTSVQTYIRQAKSKIKEDVNKRLKDL
jgi:DNA-directed RNA polymerase specialized sigma24 family protein